LQRRIAEGRGGKPSTAAPKGGPVTETEEPTRLDAWLWHARFFRRREDARSFISDGRVRIERAGKLRRCDKPGTPLAVGDVLVFHTGGVTHRVRVLATVERRGDADSAVGLYERIGP
jgi:ribosome-associated heat shock protein Hsp15